MKLSRNISNFIILFVAVSCNSDKVTEVSYQHCQNWDYAPALCIRFKDKFYYVEEIPSTNWLEAQHMCRRNNGNLVTIENADEMKALSDYFIIQKYHDLEDFAIWTAGNTAANYLYYLSIGSGKELHYMKWSKGEPKKDKHCISLQYADGEFAMHMSDCNEDYHWVCELNTTSTRRV